MYRHDGCLLRPDRIENSKGVVHALLERARSAQPIGQSGAAAIERDHPPEPRDGFETTLDGGVLEDDIQVARPWS
jgi:hypothetical protein